MTFKTKWKSCSPSVYAQAHEPGSLFLSLGLLPLRTLIHHVTSPETTLMDAMCRHSDKQYKLREGARRPWGNCWWRLGGQGKGYPWRLEGKSSHPM